MRFIIAFFFVVLSVKAQVQTEEVLLKNGNIELSGTLSFSNTEQPLLIYIAGSGNVDRNGNQEPMFKANYIKQFRDKIVSEGIAFFSYDKRTANPKNANYLKNTVFEDLVKDAKVIIQHFKSDSRFNKIILLGHSQGALVGMLASQGVDKFISLAGAGESIDKVLIRQISKQKPILANVAKQHCKELRETGAIKKVHPMLMSVFHPMNHKFLSTWMQYDPAKEIQKLKLPIAIIQGDKDLQVDFKDVKRLFDHNPNTHKFLIEDMNHVLKKITTQGNNKLKEQRDNQNSYISPDYPISKELIKVVKEFIGTEVKESEVIILGK